MLYTKQVFFIYVYTYIRNEYTKVHNKLKMYGREVAESKVK